MANVAVGAWGSGAFYPPTVRAPSRPLPLAQYFCAYVRNPISVIPEQAYHEPITRYGDRLVWVTDPALVKRILLDDCDNFRKTRVEERVLSGLLGKGILTSDGAEWRWQRRTVAPLFRQAEVLRHVGSVVASADALIGSWRSAPPGRVHEIDQDMTRVAFRVIAETMFHGASEAVVASLERLNQDYVLPMSWPLVYAVLGMPAWLPYPGRLRREKAERRMRAAVLELVHARRAPNDAGDDLLGRLLSARVPETDQPMTDRKVVDNLATFLLAGHETTAKALTWALYLLACSPSWQERLLEEVRCVAGDSALDPAQFEQLRETTKFLKEALRLYPPISSIVRIPVASVDLGGWPVRAGTLINIPIFAIHRHRQLWDDPDRFEPERFSPESEARQSRFQFMPFGGGPRVCIGAAFAMIEATVMLACFVRAARFEVPPGHVPQLLSRVALQPRGGMPLKVWMR